MKPLPLPVRVAAGLAVTAVDRARHLPAKLAELPVTMVSQALQLSMRLQQQVTELAIKGDDALATFRPVEESPEWATFDEDAAGSDFDPGSARAAARSRFDTVTDDDTTQDDADEATPVRPVDPWAAEERALLSELDGGQLGTAGRQDVDRPTAHEDEAELDNVIDLDRAQPQADTSGDAPAALPTYPSLSLPQLRAYLRRLSIDELTDLLEYERAHGDRPEFVGMLSRRITTLRDQR